MTSNWASMCRNRYRTFRAGQYGSVTHVFVKENGDRMVEEYGPQEAD